MSEVVDYIEFQTEPGIFIKGIEFKIRRQVVDIVDEELSVVECRAFGREFGSCGWFFVPPKERVRLEALGVIFREEKI